MDKYAFCRRITLHRGVKLGLLVCVALFIVVKMKRNSIGNTETLILESLPGSNRNQAINQSETTRTAENKHNIRNTDEVIVSLAKQISLYNKTVLVSLVNDAYLKFAYSWLCNTKHMGVHKSVLIITTDIESKRNLTRDWPDINVVHITLDIAKGDQDYSHVGYVKIMIRRTEILLSLLMADIELLLLEFDYMWFSNPVPTLQRIRDADILVNPVSNTKSVYNGGFIYFFPTERTKALWTEVYNMMKKLEQNIKNKENTQFISEGENDQVYLSQLIRKKYSGIRIQLLPLDTYADGKWYSMTKEEQAKIHPVVLSNNWVIGNKNKMERAKKFGHWFLNEDKSCDIDAVDKVVTKTT